MKKLIANFAIFAFVLLSGALQISAQTAISFSDPGQVGNDDNWSLGWEFSTNTNLSVTALGFFDSTLANPSLTPGLATCTSCGEVGIYNSVGTLLVSALVTTSGSQIGDFYFVPVTATTLATGQDYYIVEQTGNALYAALTNGFTVNPSINFISDKYILSDTLAFPLYTQDITAAEGGGIFGPNFEATGLSATPEPSTIILMASGFALFALMLGLRQRP